MQVGDVVTCRGARGTILVFNTWIDGQLALVQFDVSKAPAIPGFDQQWIKLDQLQLVR